MTEIQNLKKMYGERYVLNIENLKLCRGESLAIAGANGSGKSTLLKILAGIIKPTSGLVNRPSDVLYLPQKAYAFRGTVKSNMLIGAKNQNDKAAVLLERFGLTGLSDKKASSLSGGELQRLSICRLFMRECGLLLLDEPTSACDAQNAELIQNEIKKYCAENGCTLIVSTHSPALAVNTAEKLLILNNGIPEAFGSSDEIISNPPSEWAQIFIERWRI